MGVKNADRCLENCAPDEPIFVLRAQDALAPFVIMIYANLLRLMGRPKEKAESAEAVAKLMEAWPKRKLPD